MAKKTFEKQFVYRDSERIELILKDYQNSLDKVSDVFPKVEKVINRVLTDEEKLNLVTVKSTLLINILKPKFPFLNAETDFNLKALGLDIKALLDEIDNLPGIYCGYCLDGGRLAINQETLNTVEDNHTQYTENENQNKALDLANRLIENLEEAKEMGLIDVYGINQIDKVTKLLTMPLGPGGITYNRYTIKEIQ